jgi:hypothetical protein
MIEGAGQGILDVFVLAPAAFEQQLDFDVILFPLLEVDDGSVCPEVVAAVFAGEGIDRIGAQFAAAGRLTNGFADCLGESELIGAHRGMHDKGGHAGVLTDWTFLLGGHVNVASDDRQSLMGL